MVTINEEFVVNEQMNNHQNAAPPAQPVAVPAAPDAAVESEDSGDEQPRPPPAIPAPGETEQHKEAKQRKEPKKANNQAKKTRRVDVVPAAANSTRAPSQPQAPAPAPAFPHMEAVSRVLALPIVDSGVSIVSGVYSKVKNVNPVVQWGLGTVEGAVRSSLERSLSLLNPLSGPISVVDSLLCRGLDMVQHSVPIIMLPPELVMTAGKDYMAMRVVAPVLRLTAQNARLAETIATRALDSADHYVDKYLPGDAATENGDAVGSNPMKGGATFQRADRLSRKLQRRLTRRTLAEARALRKDTENTVHTLVFFAETLVKDPHAFVEQVRAVWNHLSENEPENQVPPDTLEERLALLVREVARRVVHVANFTAANANAQTVAIVANQVLKSVRVEGTKVLTYAQSQLERIHMRQVLDDVNIYTHQLLERLAHLLAGLRNTSNTMRHPFSHAGTNNIAVVN